MPLNQPIKAVVFDLDNTLLDFMKMKNASVRAAVEGMISAGLPLDLDAAVAQIKAIYDQKGYELQTVFNEYLLGEIGSVDYKYLASAIVAYRRAREASLMLYPRVSETLMKLAKKGLKLGVVSDAPSREAWMRLCYLNFHHLFDEVVTFDDTMAHKPDPAPFHEICKRLDVNFNETIMVGDWPERDLVGARNVGMITAFARYGHTGQVEQSGADYELEGIYQLVQIVDQHNRT
ncbi:MAG: HAD-IA family hydrolase [Candidatus Neomarinimicrobiota bacterium]